MSDLKRIEEKIDKIDDSVGRIDVTLAAQHESLKDHMRRTSLLEESIRPLEKHVNMFNGALKLIGILAMLAAIVEVVLLAIK